MALMKNEYAQKKILNNEKQILGLTDSLNKTRAAVLRNLEDQSDEFKKVKTQFKVLEDRIVEFKKDIKNDLSNVDLLHKKLYESNRDVLVDIKTKIQSSWWLRKLFGMEKAIQK